MLLSQVRTQLSYYQRNFVIVCNWVVLNATNEVPSCFRCCQLRIRAKLRLLLRVLWFLPYSFRPSMDFARDGDARRWTSSPFLQAVEAPTRSVVIFAVRLVYLPMLSSFKRDPLWYEQESVRAPLLICQPCLTNSMDDENFANMNMTKHDGNFANMNMSLHDENFANILQWAACNVHFRFLSSCPLFNRTMWKETERCFL